MPTSNPRIQVTLSPSLDALVVALAKHQRASKSQVLRELLEAAEPALRRVVALMNAASKASEEVRTEFRRSLDVSVARAEKSVEQTVAAIDAAGDDLVALAEAVRARRPSRRRTPAPRPAPRSRPDPPASKRGVKSKTGRGQP